MNHPEWMADAPCKGKPTEWWFPPIGNRADERGEEYTGHNKTLATNAKRVCFACPFRAECLDYGLYEPDGIQEALAL